MTDMSAKKNAVPSLAWDEESHGVEWHVELERAVLLPGRLVDGRVSLVAPHGIEARALQIALVATEHWRHRVSRTDSDGHMTTEVVTSTDELIQVPVQPIAPLRLAAGERVEVPFQLPVPPLGPASLDAEDAGLEWTVEAKLDRDNTFDSRTERSIVVAQPTALLRAGVVHVGQFALYEGADTTSGNSTASIELDPMPLVAGEAFHATLKLELGSSTRVQEIRAEIKVEVEATVSQGESESIIAWSGQLAPEGTYGGPQTFEIQGMLDARPLPTIELPHGKAQAMFHVILAIAWRPDTHLSRDIAIATTREL